MTIFYFYAKIFEPCQTLVPKRGQQKDFKRTQIVWILSTLKLGVTISIVCKLVN